MPDEDTHRVYREMHRLEDRLTAHVAALRHEHESLEEINMRRHDDNVKRLMRIESHINQTLGAYNALRYVVHVLSAVGGAVIAFVWDRLTSTAK